MELVRALRSLDREVWVVVEVVVLVDRKVDFHRRRHFHFLAHRLHLLRVVVLGRLVDTVGYEERFPFLFLYLVGDNGMGLSYFLRQNNELVVHFLPFPGRVVLLRFVVTWVKKDG